MSIIPSPTENSAHLAAEVLTSRPIMFKLNHLLLLHKLGAAVPTCSVHEETTVNIDYFAGNEVRSF